MIYLNDVEEGGETEFTKLNVKIKPKRGRAVIWGNMTSDNKVDHNTMHAGLPVIKGEKHIITKWFKKENNESKNCEPKWHKNYDIDNPGDFPDNFHAKCSIVNFAL